MSSSQPRLDFDAARRLRALAASHARLTGRSVASGAEADLEAALWACPAAILAHGTQDDPIFFYGNAAALAAFEMDFTAFTALPSRLSAEPAGREARAALLDRVRAEGIITDYTGERIAASGRRFRIEGASVWNIIAEDGAYLGQAAMFERSTA